LDPYVLEAIGKAIKHGVVMLALTAISLLPLFMAARSLSDLAPGKASYLDAEGVSADRSQRALF